MCVCYLCAFVVLFCAAVVSLLRGCFGFAHLLLLVSCCSHIFQVVRKGSKKSRLEADIIELSAGFAGLGKCPPQHQKMLFKATKR